MAAFLAARLGGSTSPESRHLIFVLPFFAIVVGRRDPPLHAAHSGGGDRPHSRAGRARGRLGLASNPAALRVGAEQATGDPRAGREVPRRDRVGPTIFCSATSRCTSERGSATAAFSDVVIPRADSALALRALRRQPQAARPRRLGARRERAKQSPTAPRDREPRSRAGGHVRDARVRAVPRDPDSPSGP